jgi:hypothetical protein
MKIENIIKRIIPTEDKRKTFLAIFYETIKYADTFGSEKWHHLHSDIQKYHSSDFFRLFTKRL